MKKMVSLVLAFFLALPLFFMATAKAKENVSKFGMLTMLNMSEEEMTQYVSDNEQALYRLISGGTSGLTDDWGDTGSLEVPYATLKIVYYDTLDAMLLALNAGEIIGLETYGATARYMILNNPELMLIGAQNGGKNMNAFVNTVCESLLSNDFAFMFMEGSADLRDAFNETIAEMKKDGTLDALIQTYIEGVAAGDEPKRITLPRADGAETLRVAITGSLPPLDYVAPDGTPAGFNTAMLAEIGSRMGKNVEIVQVDSIGRAAALASGAVDAVLWTRTNHYANLFSMIDNEERRHWAWETFGAVTEEEKDTLNLILDLIEFIPFGAGDMPNGTIISDPYYTDAAVPILTKAAGEAMKNPSDR